MKHIFVLIFSLMFGLNAIAQTSDLGKMSMESRNNYLINIANNVSKTFGPDYVKYFGQPVISEVIKLDKNDFGDSKEEFRKNIGREYYVITFPYDNSKVKLDFDFAAKVRVWKDTGEPLDVVFGNGYGRNFLLLSYAHQTMARNTIEVVPFQQAKDPESIWKE